MKLFSHNATKVLVERVVAAALAVLILGVVATPQQVQAANPVEALKEKYDAFFAQDAGKSFPVSGERAPVRTIHVAATAYNSLPGQTDDTPCIDASGIDICERAKQLGAADTIAANFVPKGTKVRFPDLYGDKVFTVTDRMNPRYNYDRLGYYKIDFYTVEFDASGEIDYPASKAAAKHFGFKKGLKMEILGV